MRLAAVTFALAAVLALVPSALAAKKKSDITDYAYKVTKAEGTETVTFQGDGTATCQAAGLCGYSGTASYIFGHPREGSALITVFTFGREHDLFGDLDFRTKGVTTAAVSQAGVAQPCVDTVKRHHDTLDVDLHRNHVVFGLHALNAAELSSDYLGTHCAGPTEADMATAGVLPAVEIPLRALKRKRIDLELHSNLPFHVGPFSGTLKVDAAYTLVRDRRAERDLSI